MIKIILPLFLLLTPVAAVASPYSELSTGQRASIDQTCSVRVGVPYGSDDMSDTQWYEFQNCRELMTTGMSTYRPTYIF